MLKTSYFVGVSVVMISLIVTSSCLGSSHVAALPKPKPETIMQSGHDLFDGICVTCHGPNAIGGEGPNLHGIDLTSDEIVAQITHGTTGEMPAFAKRFTDQQKKELAAYVGSLK